jgi:hypothetical protein
VVGGQIGPINPFHPHPPFVCREEVSSGPVRREPPEEAASRIITCSRLYDLCKLRADINSMLHCIYLLYLSLYLYRLKNRILSRLNDSRSLA